LHFFSAFDIIRGEYTEVTRGQSMHRKITTRVSNLRSLQVVNSHASRYTEVQQAQKLVWYSLLPGMGGGGSGCVAAIALLLVLVGASRDHTTHHSQRSL
jgi:hypothetical protein